MAAPSGPGCGVSGPDLGVPKIIFLPQFVFLTVFSVLGGLVGYLVDGRYPGSGSLVTVAIFMIALWGASRRDLIASAGVGKLATNQSAAEPPRGREPRAVAGDKSGSGY